MTPTRHDLVEILRSKTALFRLFDQAPSAYFLFGADGTIVGANRAGLKLVAARKTDLIGKSVYDLKILGPSTIRSGERRYAGIVSGAKVKPMEYEVSTFDGRRIVIETHLHVLEFEGQTLVMASVNDVTERKRTTELLRKQRGRLRDAAKEKEAFSRRLICVREQERQNLAYLLHHEAGTLAALLKRQVTEAVADIKEGRASESLGVLLDALTLLGRHVDTLKKYARDLRPPDLDGLGLVDLLRSLYEEAAARAGFGVSFHFTLQRRRIDSPASVVVYRVAQEALNNILNHAEAKSVDLCLDDRNGAVRLVVRDDGKGFARRDSRRDARCSMGLSSMAEMAKCLGGRVDVRSSPGKGTLVTMTLPTAAGDTGEIRDAVETARFIHPGDEKTH